MTPFKFILAATDFSQPAGHAVQRAARLARQHGARLGIVHVVASESRSRWGGWLSPPVDLEREAAQARTRLHRLAEQMSAQYDVPAVPEVRVGDVFQQLQRMSARADLLVLGQRRRHPLAEWVLGGTARRLVDQGRRPVLVVKRAAESSYQRVLVPVDFTSAGDAAIVVAASLAPDIDLQVLHVTDSTEIVLRQAKICESVIRDCRAREEAGLVARLRRRLAGLGLDSRSMRFVFGRGSAASAALDQAKNSDAELLVAARPRRSRVPLPPADSIGGLLASSRCDLLIVDPQARHDPRQAPSVAQAQAPMQRAADIGRVRTAQAASPREPSWMRSPIPSAAVLAGQRRRGRP